MSMIKLCITKCTSMGRWVSRPTQQLAADLYHYAPAVVYSELKVICHTCKYRLYSFACMSDCVKMHYSGHAHGSILFILFILSDDVLYAAIATCSYKI